MIERGKLRFLPSNRNGSACLVSCFFAGGDVTRRLRFRSSRLSLPLRVCRRFEKHAPRAEYVLTGKGHELGPVLRALRKLGDKY